MRLARANPLLLTDQRLSCVCQSKFQRFAWHALDKGAYHPAESGGDVTRQRNRFALNVGPAVFLLEAPECVETPEESSIVADWLVFLVRLACIFDFLYACAVGAADFASGGYTGVVNV